MKRSEHKNTEGNLAGHCAVPIDAVVGVTRANAWNVDARANGDIVFGVLDWLTVDIHICFKQEATR